MDLAARRHSLWKWAAGKYPLASDTPGDRQLRDELDHRNRRGQQSQGGALPSKEGALVGECEPVVRLKLRRGPCVPCRRRQLPMDTSAL
jgi:hypothetical protein